MSDPDCRRACVVCLSTDNADVPVHKFPANPVVCALWTKSCGYDELDDLKFSRVCARHFADHCYASDGRKRPKRNVAPSNDCDLCSLDVDVNDFNKRDNHNHESHESRRIISIKNEGSAFRLKEDSVQHKLYVTNQPMKTMDYEFKAHSKNQSSDMKEYVLQSLNHDHNYDFQTSKKRKTKLSADLCTPDCASSNKGKCNNVLLQMKVVEQKTKIRRLNQRIRRLLQKIKRIEKSSPAT